MERCQVLHVTEEDEAAYRVQNLIRKTGMEIHVYRVSDGEEALNFLCKAGVYRRARTPELTIIDLESEDDSWELLRRIRETPFLSSLLVAVVSERPAAFLKLGERWQGTTLLDSPEAILEQVRTACPQLTN